MIGCKMSAQEEKILITTILFYAFLNFWPNVGGRSKLNCSLRLYFLCQNKLQEYIYVPSCCHFQK